ncbi:hypothetical protein LXM50_08685 [Microbacterium sp. Au-Mic1]|uniref:hypothetical protein n=1 Tax=Microbacterium sp. Au-Mic1 TaxID=2906457 RepID=UPI001E2AC108|nr:hypothetical protein [Microbacterium sp. Au-Mic1]MCE4026048.1 hypothetical protein [Microbacterium sp. Au-Mic1]
MAANVEHRILAEDLRAAVASGVDAHATSGAMRIGAGAEAAVAEPYAALARTVGEASYRVTDELVAAARRQAGSDRGAFEVIMSAGVGAALRRWDTAILAIEEVADEAR